MVTYDRWLITPAAQDTDEGGWFPKYSDDPEISGFSGNTFDNQDVIDAGYGHLLKFFPDVTMWYVVRMYGTEAALDGVEGNSDVISLADVPDRVIQIMDQRFGGPNWKFEIN